MNSGYEKRKVILIKYCRCLIFSALGGGLILIFADKNFICSLSNGIKVHFELPFRSVENFILLVCKIFGYSLRDILIFAIVFAASFITSSLIPIYIVLAYRGISLGVSLTALCACKIYSGFPRIDSIAVYLLFEVICVIVLLGFISLSIHFSKELIRTRNEVGAYNTYKKLKLSYALYFLLTCGFIVVLNFIYCMLIYIT
jgi:hypothetical protein